MTAGWMAAVVRGEALLGRTVGPAGARAIAGADDWPSARRALASTAYGRELPPDADRRTARVTAERATAWQIRVLAGWLPPGGAAVARLAIAPFEIGNLDRRLVSFVDGTARFDPSDAVDLGPLGAAWPAAARAATSAEVRALLRRSSWGDPGGDGRAEIAVGLRVSWARRAMRVDPVVRPWALGALAVLVARERFVFDRPITEVTARSVDRAFGPRWRDAGDVDGLRARIPEGARWPLPAGNAPSDLWRSELALLARIGREAGDIATTRRPVPATVVAVLALLLVDTWRVTAAIEAAGRGPAGREVLDAVAA